MADSDIDVKRDRAETPTQRTEARPATRDTFQAFRQEMDRMFDQFWRGVGLPSLWRGEGGFGLAAPAVDLAEDDKAYHLSAEMPGLTDKDVNVTLSGDMLTITGEKRDEREEKQKNYHFSERRFGSFRRAIALPQHIDRDRIDASFKNGVLSVAIPKSSDAMRQQKKIEVKGG